MAKIETYRPFDPRIYAYTTQNISTNEGWIKIGYTTQNVSRRIYQQTHTAGVIAHLEWDLPARFEDTGETFFDTAFHEYLVKTCNVRRRLDLEWFKLDAATALKYFNQFRARQFPAKEEFYTLRAEQAEAVQRTLKYFQSGDTPREFLWNAKPRFGKTLTTYEFIRQLNFQCVLIVTNRPSIANSWLDDFNRFIAHQTSYKFVCNGGDFSGKSVDREFKIPRGQQIIAFLSLQDLKGAKTFGGDFDKLNWIAKTKWDLLIVDEAHEGVDTEKTDAAFKKIKCDFTLYLSGTPFKALAGNKFRADQIFNWSYEDEQAAKKNWREESSNPYEDLPQMNMLSYQIPQATIDKINRGVELKDGEHVESAFDLNEFFRTDDSGKFVHEADVKAFLDDLSTKKDFPFSPAFREELRHTFWLLQYVDSAYALAALLREHPVFKHYKVIVAAGKNLVDEYKLRDSYEKVQHAIKNHDKTITLSVGQLTTGVTVPGWTGVLMLSNLKSAAAYMQAAFRAQNPHVSKNFRKENCYVFDFAPERSLKIYDEFANNLRSGAAAADRAKNIGELLNFFPILSQDDSGAMTPLSTASFTSILNKIKIREVVDNRFIDNNLFDNVSHVFGAAYQNEVLSVLNKLPADDSNPDEKNPPEIKIVENPEVKLGEKKLDSSKAPANPAPEKSDREKIIELLAKDIAKLFEKDIAAQKFSKQQTAKLRADSNHRIRKKLSALETFSEPEIQKIVDAEKIALETTINELKIANEKKTFDDNVRARLRSFARTIPSFIMAYCAEARAKNIDITLKNFETLPDDKTFLEVTSLTKDEFRTLRRRKLFSEAVFNGAIVEFLKRKDELADYFSGAHDKDIFDFIPPQRTNQIFTPKAVVVQIVDALEAQNPGIFDDPNQKFIDPYMKSGLFVAEIVKRLFEHFVRRHRLKNKKISDKAKRRCLKHILTRQVFGIAPTEIIFRIATEYIFGATANSISRKNFFCSQRLEVTALEKFGEVFTPPDTVKSMLSYPDIQAQIRSLHSRFFEPATGEAAFLSEILRQKLSIHANDNSDSEKFRYNMLWCLASLYGLEIQPKNVDAAKKILFDIFATHYKIISGTLPDNQLACAANFILNQNILQGDATDKSSQIQFSVWENFSGDIHLARRFAFPYSNFFPDDKNPAQINPFNFFSVSEPFDLINIASQSFHEVDQQSIADQLRNFVVVCNPPYQADDRGDTSNYATPVYDKFLDNYHAACNKVIMIHPARFLFNAGATSQDFNDRKLADVHFTILRYFPKSADVFSGVDIKGGIAITYRDENKIFGAIQIYIPFPELKSIFDKVTTRKDFKPLSEIIYSQKLYKFSQKFYADNPYVKKLITDGRTLKTNAFETLPEFFTEDKPNDGAEYIQIYGMYKKKRAFRFVRADFVDDNINYHKYKIFIPKAYGGAGALRENGPTMLVGLPLVGCTESFVTLGAFDNAAETESALKYVKTKFARVLLGVLKVTQEATPDKWRYVPQQDFSAGSDVPWGLSVAEVDAYLYEKYQLTAEEIAFIEANVKAMN